MKFAKWVFFLAGLYGLALIAPVYFLEGFLGRLAPPEINHPEFYYGFLGVALAWQVVYLVISRDPRRYRPMMLVSIAAKLAFVIPMLALFALGRVAPLGPISVIGDFVFAALFAYAYVATANATDSTDDAGRAMNWHAAARSDSAIKFTRNLFLIAGIGGFIMVAPLYFLEGFIGRQDPPEISHPEFFYGFVGAALVWQALFIVLSRDPLRYRPMIPASIVEKFGFSWAVFALFALGRVAGTMLAPASIDFTLGVLFVAAYVALARRE
jgi:hypothetical protein